MTAQINDMFHFRGREYAVAGISEGELFDPSLLDLKPAAACTACWRGYQAIFGVSDSRLVLETLHVNLFIGQGPWESDLPADCRPPCRRQQGPVINGVKPTGPKGERDWFNNHYEGIKYHLEYKGGLLLADGFIEKLYVHMGFHPPWKYETVIELIFDAGGLIQEVDRSAQMAEIRKMILESRTKASSNRGRTPEEIIQFVKQAFDRSYPM